MSLRDKKLILLGKLLSIALKKRARYNWCLKGDDPDEYYNSCMTHEAILKEELEIYRFYRGEYLKCKNDIKNEETNITIYDLILENGLKYHKCITFTIPDKEFTQENIKKFLEKKLGKFLSYRWMYSYGHEFKHILKYDYDRV